MKMKKLILMMAIAAVGLGGCEKRPEPLKIDNALTAGEIAAGRLTPEVMWKMSRATEKRCCTSRPIIAWPKTAA